jgi:hypothetical protein
MSQIPVRAIGIAWYRREDWDELRRLFVDTDVLPDTYNSWLSVAEKLVQNITRQGGIAEKVYIEPREFARWCAVRGLDIDAKARTRYANEFVARKYRNQD